MLAVVFASGCSSGTAKSTADAGPLPDANVVGWPSTNEWSWNGSWTPTASDFPVQGLLDEKYNGGSADAGVPDSGMPMLPPGRWDEVETNNDLAHYNAFSDSVGRLEPVRDSQERQYGWRVRPLVTEPMDYSGAATYFDGSSGADLLHFGRAGKVHSITNVNLGDGPDELIFHGGFSFEVRTGSSATGALHDDDLVLAGCSTDRNAVTYLTSSVLRTGPGSDWVFAGDFKQFVFDLGNGENGRTDTIDMNDGKDYLAVRGNTNEFRVMGGRGDDIVAWYVNENRQDGADLKASFYGGGSAGDAIWGDTGTDRLILVIDPATEIIQGQATEPGSIGLRLAAGDLLMDPDTMDDPMTSFCVDCGTSPDDRRTLILEYLSEDSGVYTGMVLITAFELLQIGAGSIGVVYRIDDVNGELVRLENEIPVLPPAWPQRFCN